MPTEREELTEQYRRILRAGYESAQGEPISEELKAAGEASLLSSADHLANQLENSILDAPWLRSRALSIVNDWIGSPDPESGILDFADLRTSLEPIFGASRSLMIARSETAGVFNGAMAAGLRAHGWSHVTWIASDNACEECLALDGQVMSIAEYEANSTLHPNCACTAEPFDGDMSEDGDLEATGESEE